eukprot:CAMPEP_0114580934 /NCGR_PEP_ID=MMETSP0125-20121206/5101_1 /TAXON_ID=485358 ORGANISM="Aristerostoma sp., Strain ATCC 50986" /NCGR_SAMPLE_ID=MMETSP0125 /ASSEMBLY_ACC=CAM_ASM_000245 /LENGTH=151 /DNA_ID=CAMNT_0001772755 /DNA_START=361 /DNA_END=816 /DNA_ORIENTATION=-
MTACLYGSQGCSEKLVEFGGIAINLKGKDGRTALQYAKKKQDVMTYKMLKELEAKYEKGSVENFITPINPSKLENTQRVSQDGEKSAEFKEAIIGIDENKLKKEGVKKECVKCNGSKGVIMYAQCCGAPVHGACGAKCRRCPNCNNIIFRL